MKKLSFILSTVMLLSTALPMSGFAAADDPANLLSMKRSQNEWFYEDFSKFADYTSLKPYSKDGGIGYISSNATTDTVEKAETNGDTAVKVKGGTKTVSVKGPSGDNRTGENDVYNTRTFNVSTAAFEDAGKALVLSYDVYIPKLNPSRQSSNKFFNGDNEIRIESKIGRTGTGDMSHKEWLTKSGGIMVHWSQGPQMFAYNGEFTINGTHHLGEFNKIVKTSDGLPTEAGWYTLQTVLTYNAATKSYTSYTLMDGKPICNTDGTVAKTVVTLSDDYLKTIRGKGTIAFQIDIRSGLNGTTSGDSVLLDNVAMYLCDAAQPGQGTVSDKTITIPFTNGMTFNNSTTLPSGLTTPEAVAKGYLDVTTAKNASVKLNGSTVVGTTATASDNELTITLPAYVGEGDKVTVDLAGVKDIAGNQVGTSDSEYTIEGVRGTTDNAYYFEDFEGATSNLTEVGYNPGAISDTNTRKRFELTTTAKGKGMAHNAGQMVAPTGDNKFMMNSAYFENAGKELEYGCEIFIPDTMKKGQAIYLVLADERGNTIQYISDLPSLAYAYEKPRFLSVNGDSLASDATYDATNNPNGTRLMYAAPQKIGIDQSKDLAVTPYEVPKGGQWVKLKSKVTYIAGTDGNNGYYLTKHYINGEVVRNAYGSPAIYKVEALEAPRTGNRCLQLSYWGGNESNKDESNRIVIDNVYIKTVDREDGELTVFDFKTDIDEKTATIVYNNLSNDEQSYRFILGGYGADGALVDVAVSAADAKLAPHSTGEITITLDTEKDIETLKPFLWKDFATCVPIR